MAAVGVGEEKAAILPRPACYLLFFCFASWLGDFRFADLPRRLAWLAARLRISTTFGYGYGYGCELK